MSARSRLLSVFCLLLTACGGPTFQIDGEDVEPLRLAVEQQTLRYHVAQSMRVRIEPEDGVATGAWRRSELISTVEMGAPDPTGRARVTVTYDALRGEVDDGAGAFVFDGAWVPSKGDRSARARAIREMRQRYLDDAYSYTVNARGEINIVRAGQTSLGEVWPDWVGPLPNSAAKPGDTWVSESTVEWPKVGPLRKITTLTMGETGRYGVVGCAEITFETRYGWPNPQNAPDVNVDPSAQRDSGRLCMGFNGVPLQQEIVSTRLGTSRAGEVSVEYRQTRNLIPIAGSMPWTLEVPPGPPPPAKAAAPLSAVTPTLPEGATRRLGAALGSFHDRIDDVEPAPKGSRVAVASGRTITFVDAADSTRTASIIAPCPSLAQVVWSPDGQHLLGLCEPGDDEDARSVHVWRVADGTLERTALLPAAPLQVSVAVLNGVASAFAVDEAGQLWRFELVGDAPPEHVALAWPESPAEEPEPDALYEEPDDPLLFSRFLVAPDGFHAAGVADGRLVLVDAGAKQVRRVMDDLEVVVRDLTWLPGRTARFVVAVDNRLEIWAAEGEGPLPGASVKLEGPAWEGAERISLSENGKRLLVWQAKQGTTVWRVAGDRLVAEVMPIAAKDEAVITGNGRFAVSRSRYANVLHVFDIKSGRDKRLGGPHGERIADLAVAPDGKHIATADLSGWVQVWSVADGKPGARFKVEAAPQKYGNVYDTFVGFDSSKRLVVGHPLGGGFRNLDGQRARYIEEHFWGIERFKVDRRGRRALAIKHGFAGVVVYSMEGKAPRELWGEKGSLDATYGGGRYICGGTLSRDGSRVAFQWSDGEIEVRVTDGGRAAFTVRAEPSHCRPALSGDGDRLAYVDAQTAAIQVVDKKGRPVATLPGSRSVLYGGIVLDTDGDRVAAARGRSLWLFGLGEKTTTRTLEVPEGEVALIEPIGDDQLVTTTSNGTSAIIWPWP